LLYCCSRSGYANTYQPGKYGIPSDPGYNTASSAAVSNYRNIGPDDSSKRPDNGYDDRNYGFVGREFDLEPYRSASHRVTDYSSDTGHGVTRGLNRQTDYSSDSGRSHLSRPLSTDYSSDSGLVHRNQHRKRSSDFDLEIPSLDTSHSPSRSQNEDLFSSPVKSHLQPSEFEKLTKNQGNFGDEDHLNQFDHYRNLSRSEPNLDKKNGLNASSRNTRSNQNIKTGVDHANPHENGNSKHLSDTEDDYGVNFSSPPLYHGDIADTTVAHRSKPPGVGVGKGPRSGDLTKWQREFRAQSPTRTDTNVDIEGNERLTHKPPAARNSRKDQVGIEIML